MEGPILPFPNTAFTEVTQNLNAIQQGDPSTSDKLLPVVYEELRVLARQRSKLDSDELEWDGPNLDRLNENLLRKIPTKLIRSVFIVK